jgi:hypothetical protein
MDWNIIAVPFLVENAISCCEYYDIFYKQSLLSSAGAGIKNENGEDDGQIVSRSQQLSQRATGNRWLPEEDNARLIYLAESDLPLSGKLLGSFWDAAWIVVGINTKGDCIKDL